MPGLSLDAIDMKSDSAIALDMQEQLEAMSVNARTAFWDYVNEGPKRKLGTLAEKYKELRETGLETPTASLPTLTTWSRQFGWQRLVHLVEAQQAQASRAYVQGQVDVAAEKSIERLIELLDADQAIVLRKGGNQRGDDVVEYHADNRVRLDAAKTILDRAGIVPTKLSISEQIARRKGELGNEQSETRTIEVEGKTAEELMLALRGRLIAPESG